MIQQLLEKGYPLPAVINDNTLRAELVRVRALETYAEQ